MNYNFQKNNIKNSKNMKKKQYIKPNIHVVAYDTGNVLMAASSVTGTLPDKSNIDYGGSSSKDPNQGQGGDAKKFTNAWNGWED